VKAGGREKWCAEKRCSSIPTQWQQRHAAPENTLCAAGSGRQVRSAYGAVKVAQAAPACFLAPVAVASSAQAAGRNAGGGVRYLQCRKASSCFLQSIYSGTDNEDEREQKKKRKRKRRERRETDRDLHIIEEEERVH